MAPREAECTAMSTATGRSIFVIRVSLEYDEKIDREMADVNLDEKIDMKDILLLMKEVI